MKKTNLIITMVLVLALAAGSAFAWGPGKGKAGGYNCPAQAGGYNCQGQGSRGCPAAGDLTQEQQDQLSKLKQKFTDESYEIRSAKLEKRQQIRLIMETSNPDRAKIEALHDEMDNLRKQLRAKRLDFQLEAKKIAPELSFGQGFGGAGRKGSNFGNGKNCGQNFGQGRGHGRCFN